MTWQRRVRLLLGAFAVVFGVFVAFAFRRHGPAPSAAPVARVDPGAVAESTGARLERFNLSRESGSVFADRQLTYGDGSSKLFGVTIVANRRDPDGPFTVTAKEADVAKDETAIVLNGNVQLSSSDIRSRTEHATFSKSENVIRAPGPAEFTEGRTTASGVGMTFDRGQDTLTILDQAVVRMAPDPGGADATEITCGTAVFARRERYRQFEKQVRIRRGSQVLEAEAATAHMSEDGERIESVDLRGGARIVAAHPAPGALQSLGGRDVSLRYADQGRALDHVVIAGGAAVEVAGEAGQPGRRIAAGSMDIALAADGATPTALVGHDGVRLVLPPAAGTPGRTINAETLEASGAPGRGLTHARFTTKVRFREQGSGAARAANAGALDVGLPPGLAGIDEATFAHAARFEEGRLTASAASARYNPVKGTLALSGSEPGALVPRLVNERIAIDAAGIDVTLAGPVVHATGGVKSVLQPARSGQAAGPGGAVKMPSLLKQDQPVNVLADSLEYDGAASRATYHGEARLFQGDTSIKADTIAVDSKAGDLTASGGVMTTTLLAQNGPMPKGGTGGAKEKSRSIATAKDVTYRDAGRLLTYTGDAHLSGPAGDMKAAKIELYLTASGDELERAEAYEAVTLREQNRTTTGLRMTYTASDERYVVTGAPVAIVDECGRETSGRTLIFTKSSDSIVVDGNHEIRTQTKGGGKCP